MDRARKARKPLRSRVTRIINQVQAELQAEDPQKASLVQLLTRLEEAREELRNKDEAIMNALLDTEVPEQELEREDEEVDGYHAQIIDAKLRIEYAIAPQVPDTTANANVPPAADKKTFRLPKIELPKFNGDLRNWLGWWSQFEKIDRDPGLHNSDKFQYLIQATEDKSEPREIISAFPPTGDNYEPAMESLKRRYGRKGLQLQVYLRELLNLVIVNVTKKEKISLDKLYLKLESHLRALNTLDLSKAEPSMYFYPLVESSLPEDVLRTWLRNPVVEIPGNGNKVSKLENLMEFLKKEVEGEQQILLAKNTFEDQKPKHTRARNNRDEEPTAASLLNNLQVSGCIFCNKSNHASKDCFKANKMTMEERKCKIQEARSCFACLKKGHSAKDCRSPGRCPVCNRKHFPVMCPERDKPKNPPSEQVTDNRPSVQVESSVVSFNHTQKSQVILMKTLHVQVRGPTGKSAEVRLLFDEGSQRSYITNSLAQKIDCKVVDSITIQNALFGGVKTAFKNKNKYKVSVESIYAQDSRKKLELIGEDVICSYCPCIPEGPWIKTLKDKNIQLSDASHPNPEIQILVGSDLWGSLMTGRMLKLEGGLVAVESVFGWTLSERVPVQDNSSLAITTLAMFSREEKTLPDLWNLEAIGIQDTAEKISQEEHEAVVKGQFQASISKDSEGRYEVKLPWIPDPPELPSNRKAAEKRLITASEKLLNRGEFDAYDKVFKDWENKGIIEEVPDEESPGDYYLPHRPVFKESLTTPVRPVFDASARVGKSPSLNMCLEKGPNMLELIPAIMLRFRAKPVGAIADIRKAFQMVGVAKEERKFQKFLWWSDVETKTLKVYRHCRVVFGMNCSPFVLAAVLDYHLSQVPEEDKPIAEILRKALYVDNSLNGFFGH